MDSIEPLLTLLLRITPVLALGSNTGGQDLSLARSILRWLAVPIVVAAVIALSIALASWAVTVADQSCTSMVGGTCVESWHSDAVEWAVYIAIVLAVLAIPLLSAWLAPAYKKATALIMGLLGATPLLLGYFMTNWQDLLLPSLLGISSALLGIYLVWRRRITSNPTETSSA